MVSVATFTRVVRSRLLPAKRGWIGIDFGSQYIKLAQITREDDSYRLAATWLLKYPDDALLTRESFQETPWKEIVAALRGLSSMFQGKDCAATIPMAFVDTRAFEIPRGDVSEMRDMVREELAADLGQEPNDLAYDFWEVASDGGDPGLMRVLALAIPQQAALALGKNLLRTRLECQAIDGAPCALARAVAMAAPANDEPVAAIDLGYTSASLVVVHAGQPVFFRSLRDVGLQSLTAPLRQGLRLSEDECRQLLLRHGIPIVGEPATAAAHATLQHLAHGLDKMTNEVSRTLAFLGQQFRRYSPQRIWLFGGGAMIRNLPQYLQQGTQLPVAVWRLPGTNDAAPNAQDALFGVAAGLSQLAWEKRTCM